MRALLKFVGVEFAERTNHFITVLQSPPTSAKLAKMSKDSKEIPNLVYHMEKFDVAARKLDSKVPNAKSVTKTFKRSVARDFRLKMGKRKEPEAEPEANKPKKRKAKAKTKAKAKDQASEEL
jgi:hypothetical protein